MSNWNNTLLRCSNPEVVNAFVLALRKSDPDMGEKWINGDTEIHICMKNITPFAAVEEVSKQFLDDIITCNHFCEFCDYSRIIEYRNGEGEHVNILRGCYLNYVPLNNKKDQDGIFSKAKSFFHRIDQLETSEDSEWSLYDFDDEVCYKFKYGGEGGKKYQVEVKKLGEDIDLKVYESHGDNDWREISGKTQANSDDTPF